MTDTEIQEARRKVEEAEKQVREAQRNLRKATFEMDMIIDGNEFPFPTKPYWFLSNWGDKWEVCTAIFGPGGRSCKNRAAAKNCYRTKEKAQEVADIRNALTSKMEGWV